MPRNSVRAFVLRPVHAGEAFLVYRIPYDSSQYVKTLSAVDDGSSNCRERTWDRRIVLVSLHPVSGVRRCSR